MSQADIYQVRETYELPTAWWPRNEKRPIALSDSQARMLGDLLRQVEDSPTGEVRLTLKPGQRRALRGVLAEVGRVSRRA